MDIIGSPAEKIHPGGDPPPAAPPKDLMFGLVEDIADAVERFRDADRAAQEEAARGDPHNLAWIARAARDRAAADIALAKAHAGFLLTFLFRQGVEHYRAALAVHLAELPPFADLVKENRELKAAARDNADRLEVLEALFARGVAG